MSKEIITPNDELKQLVKDGHFFNFCCAFALNKGYRNAMKEKKEVNFSVGDYDVRFDSDQMCFVLTHKIYFARIITAYFRNSIFIGDSEDEVINELLTELEKAIETLNTILE
jgi:hypothetical protein